MDYFVSLALLVDPSSAEPCLYELLSRLVISLSCDLRREERLPHLVVTASHLAFHMMRHNGYVITRKATKISARFIQISSPADK